MAVAVSGGMTTTTTGPANRLKRDMSQRRKSKKVMDLDIPVVSRKKTRRS